MIALCGALGRVPYQKSTAPSVLYMAQWAQWAQSSSSDVIFGRVTAPSPCGAQWAPRRTPATVREKVHRRHEKRAVKEGGPALNTPGQVKHERTASMTPDAPQFETRVRLIQQFCLD